MVSQRLSPSQRCSKSALHRSHWPLLKLQMLLLFLLLLPHLWVRNSPKRPSNLTKRRRSPRRALRPPNLHPLSKRSPPLLHRPPASWKSQPPKTRKKMLFPRSTRKAARAPWTTSQLTASTWTRALASRARLSVMVSRSRRVLRPAKPCRCRGSSHQWSSHHPNRAQKKHRSAQRPPKRRRLSNRSKTKIRERLKKLIMRTLTRSTRARRRSLMIWMTWTSTTPSRSWLPSKAT